LFESHEVQRLYTMRIQDEDDESAAS
jgi:hypothetical protein